MNRISVLIATTAILTSVFTTTALAGPKWCEEDPVFSVNGIEVDITTGFDLSSLPYAQSATFELQVPSNVVAVQVTTPGTVPITTTISKVLAPYSGTGPIPVVSLVTVKGTKSFPTSTQIVGLYGTLASWTDGTSNKTQKISFSLLHP
jgi:hypothetical protein